MTAPLSSLRWSVAAAALALSACVGQSSLSGGTAGRDTPGSARISGQLQNADGSPAANVKVFLARRPGIAEGLFGLFVAGLTFGLACAGDEPLAICDGGASTVTGADGSFEFTSSSGEAERLSLFAQLAPGPSQANGVGLAADFGVAAPGLDLPDLRFWNPALDLRSVGEAAQLAWEPLGADATAGEAVRYRASFGDGATQPVLGLETRDRSARFDPRLLEDSRGLVAVSASTKVSGNGVVVDATFSSAARPYTGTAGAPFSRGKSCGTGPCPLTDGNFANAPNPAPAELIVDLGVGRPLDLVVVRGPCVACSLESSNDGASWQPLDGQALDPSVVGGVRAFVPNRSGETRLVRVRPDVPANTAAAELSLWEGGATAPLARIDGPLNERVAQAAAQERGDGGVDGGVDGLLLLVAGVLLGAALAGAGLAFSRR